MGKLRLVAILSLAAATGCGGSGNSSSGGGSGADCSASEPCPDGEYCAADETCTADCTVGSDECGEGFSCTLEGRCVANSTNDGGVDGDGGNECANVDLNLAPTIPTVMLLVDRSASMNSAISAEDSTVRWTAVRDALVDPDDGVVTRLEGQVSFGATLYSAIRNGGFNGSEPDDDVSLAPCPRMPATAETKQGNLEDIETLFEDNGPTGGTPTAQALSAVAAGFPEPINDGPKIIVLATDGAADSCQQRDEDAGTLGAVEDAAETAFGAGITTFVLSLGDDLGAPDIVAHLQRVANEGQGLDRETGEAQVFTATTSQQLRDAFDDIIIGARDCELTLNGELVIERAGEGTVTLNGNDLAFGDDWEVLDASTIALVGEACTTLKTSENVSLSASFPCGAASIIQ